jgi:uncharacterized RDD family membrane protein YckC
MSETFYGSLPDPEAEAEFYADVPVKRLLAWVVDTVLVALITLVALPFTLFTGLFFLPLLWLVLSFLYRWVTIANRSATWGMRLVSLEFRDARGQRFDAMTAFLHTLGYAVSMAMTPLQLVSIALMLTTRRAQGLTDHVLGTVALNCAATR